MTREPSPTHAPTSDPPTIPIGSGPGLRQSLRRLVVGIGVAVVVAAAAITVVEYRASPADVRQPQAGPAQAGPETSQPASPPPAEGAVPPAPTDSRMDEYGFTEPAVRCEQSRRAVALALTERSAVVICQGADRRFEYRGLRLRDNAMLTIAATPWGADGFTADNDGVTYLLGPTELVVSAGDSVLTREPVLAYRGSAGAPAPPSEPRAEFPALPVTAEGVGNDDIRFTATGLWQFGYNVRCPAGVVVGGSIAGGRPQQRPSAYADLRGDSSSVRDGVSRRNAMTGPVILSVVPFDARCAWKLSAFRVG